MARWLVLLGLMAPLLAGADSHIRTLAGSCAACHGTNGNSVGGTPVLAGLDPSHFKTQMRAFRNGERASTVMYRHAKGLNEEEIGLLADYFSLQSRVTANAPMPLRGLE